MDSDWSSALEALSTVMRRTVVEKKRRVIMEAILTGRIGGRFG